MAAKKPNEHELRVRHRQAMANGMTATEPPRIDEDARATIERRTRECRNSKADAPAA